MKRGRHPQEQTAEIHLGVSVLCDVMGSSQLPLGSSRGQEGRTHPSSFDVQMKNARALGFGQRKLVLE